MKIQEGILPPLLHSWIRAGMYMYSKILKLNAKRDGFYIVRRMQLAASFHGYCPGLMDGRTSSVCASKLLLLLCKSPGWTECIPINTAWKHYHATPSTRGIVVPEKILQLIHILELLTVWLLIYNDPALYTLCNMTSCRRGAVKRIATLWANNCEGHI